MLTVYHGPRLIDRAVVQGIVTYREAVRTCWHLRTRRSLTRRQLAEEVPGLYASHLSDYLAEQENKRELPARHIVAFENALGNRVITQWLNRQAQLTVMEEFIASSRRVA